MLPKIGTVDVPLEELLQSVIAYQRSLQVPIQSALMPIPATVSAVA